MWPEDVGDRGMCCIFYLYLWPSHNAAASACPLQCPTFLQLLFSGWPYSLAGGQRTERHSSHRQFLNLRRHSFCSNKYSVQTLWINFQMLFCGILWDICSWQLGHQDSTLLMMSFEKAMQHASLYIVPVFLKCINAFTVVLLTPFSKVCRFECLLFIFLLSRYCSF